ncbi:hypothetical protein [Nannocystis radixulma]|uniref:Uncharacterized protein n=1 Tax=Nannocystis radixulma TaxID=2995305 RepID=A0ABT5BJP5_9BACT|nr:hypothetical protein [Nannocystis radixulma]MDC0674337.1 hypothetical protein [Nannocystis radixulma]
MNRTVVFVGAVHLGASAPLTPGCQPPCEEDDPAPSYEILTDRPDWEPGSGRVRVEETRIVIAYTTTDGSQWEVEYTR